MQVWKGAAGAQHGKLGGAIWKRQGNRKKVIVDKQRSTNGKTQKMSILL